MKGLLFLDHTQNEGFLNYLIRYYYHYYVISNVIIKNQNKLRTPPHWYSSLYDLKFLFWGPVRSGCFVV